MKRFELGQTYEKVDWFTGGVHEYICTSRTDKTVKFSPVYHEIDGTHHVKQELHDILTDDEGEYVVLYEYQGEKNCIRA